MRRLMASSAWPWPMIRGAELPLEPEHRAELVAQHLADGDAGPAGDHLAHERRRPRIPAPAASRPAASPAPSLRRAELGAERSARRFSAAAAVALELAADLADLLHQSALALPPLGERRQPGLGLELAGGDARRAARRGRRRPRSRAPAPAVCTSRSSRRRRASSTGGRRRVLAQRQAGAGGVEHAHRLVGQLPVGQVAVGQPHRRIEPVVEDAHQVMLLERRRHAAHHQEAHLLGRLLDLDELEPARQRGILLEVLLVLRPGRGRDGAQLAAGQRRLEQVGGVALSRLAAGADHRVRLVDEQDDRRRPRTGPPRSGP